MEEKGEGVEKLLVKQPCSQPHREHPRHARRATRSHSIRKLLCDNADCTLCNEAARQAAELVYTERASMKVPSHTLSPPPAATSPKGRGLQDRCMCQGLSLLPWCRCRVSPVYNQVPPPAEGPLPPHKSRSPPERQAGDRKTEHHPRGHAKSSPREWAECLSCSLRGHETRLRRQDPIQSSLPSQPEPSRQRWEQDYIFSARPPKPPRHSWGQAPISTTSQVELVPHRREKDKSSLPGQQDPSYQKWEQDYISSARQPEPSHQKWEQDYISSAHQPEPSRQKWEQDYISSARQPEPSHQKWEQDYISSARQPEPSRQKWEQDYISSARQPEPSHQKWEQDYISSARQSEPSRHSWEQDQRYLSSQLETAHHSWEQAQVSSSGHSEFSHHSWEQTQVSSSGHWELSHHTWEQTHISLSSHSGPSRHSWEQTHISLSGHSEPSHRSWEQIHVSSSGHSEPSRRSWEQTHISFPSHLEPSRHSWEQARSSSSGHSEPPLPSWEQAHISSSSHSEPPLPSWVQDQSSSYFSREEDVKFLSTQHAVSHTRRQQKQTFPGSQLQPFLHSRRPAESYSSCQHELSLLTGAPRTSSQPHEMFPSRQEEYPGPSPAQPQPFPPSQAARGWGSTFLHSSRARSPQATPQRQLHRPDRAPFVATSQAETRTLTQEAKWQSDHDILVPRAAEGPLESLAMRLLAWGSSEAPHVHGRIEFFEVETPFLQRDVRVNLEWHVQVKRLQHALGLPCTLQKALKSFMPPTLKVTSRRAPRGGTVVIVPQALPFLSATSRTKLERHLERMVNLKRWGLPKRIQDSLRLMKPAASSQHPDLGLLPPGRRFAGGPGSAKRAGQIPHPRAKAPRGATRAHASTPSSQCCRETSALQGHIARKSLEVRLGALPAMLRSSQKIAARGRKDRLLPKLIPRGCRAPLARHQLCPSLQRLAASVEVNVRHKYMQYRWALPTLYAESLARMMSGPAGPPTPSLPLATVIDVCQLETPFVARQDWELLERHILRKRLQHEWGLPSLVRRSLGRFIPPPPAHPRPKARVCLAAAELRVSSGIPPISQASARELEAHIRHRVVQRRWGLPRRVRESLRVFTHLTPTAPGPHLDTRGARARRPLRESSGRRAPSKSASRRTFVGLATVPVSAAGGLGAAWSQQLSWDTCHQLLERHVARKNMEIQLGLIPSRAQSSQEVVWQLGKLPLPRLIHPGRRSLEWRTQELLFLEPGASTRVQLNLRHKHLNFLWGLPTLYHRSLAKLFHKVPAPALQPSSTHPTPSKFVEQELPFLLPGPREAMERHIRKKRLQHEWGLPLIIQKSIRGLQGAPPPPSQPRAPPPAHVAVLQPELSFLSEGSKRELELSLHKRLMHRRWGLPKRIVESVRLLQPASAAREVRPQVPRETAPQEPLLPWHKSTAHVDRGMEKSLRVVAAAPPQLSLSREAQEQLQLHVAKKCVEIRLGANPVVVRHSWQRLRLVSRLPLPKLIPPGDRIPEARNPLLPFMQPEDVSRLEMMVHHKHLTALWGLGTLYTQSLGRMVPRAPPRPVPHHTANVEFSAQDVLFLSPEAREALERHVRKKRLQHEWGLPLIIQKSIRALQGAPPPPSQPRAPLQGHVAVLQPELCFLSEGSKRELELSLHKRLMHRRWGLPKRIVESVRLLQPASAAREVRPQVPRETAPQEPLLPWHKSTAHVDRGMEKSLRVVAAAPPQLSLSREAQERLRLHVAKKCVEIRLGASPVVVRRSWQRLCLVSQLPLPKLIPPGDRIPEARNPLLPFMQPEDVSRLEMMVHHKHLTALWGLGTLYTQSLGRMVPGAPPRPVPHHTANVEISAQDVLFLSPEAREALELHIRKKRLQHEWGLPTLIARSLRAFAPEPLQLAPDAPRYRTELHLLILKKEPPLIDQGSRSHLEHHLRKMILQRRWGLPRRIQESLRVFSALVPAARPQLPEASGEKDTRLSQLGLSQADLPSKSRWEGASPREREDDLQQGVPEGMEAEKSERNGYRKPATLTETGTVELTVPQTGPPLLTDEAKDCLESHILRKKLQHLWGLPGVVQRSLGTFTPSPPGRQAQRWYQAPAEGASTVSSLLFLSMETRQLLESHMRRLVQERRWGLPKRIQEALRIFRPPGAEPRGQTQALHHVYSKPSPGPAAPSRGQPTELQTGPVEALAYQSQHWQEIGMKEGKAVTHEVEPPCAMGSSSSGGSQETSQMSDVEGLPDPTHLLSPEQSLGFPHSFSEDTAELKSTLDFPREKVLGISPESQRQALRPRALEPYPQHREPSSEENSEPRRIHDHRGTPWPAGPSMYFQSSSVETAVWSEKKISRELESSFRKIAQSRSCQGLGAKQPLSPEITYQLEMGHCTCFDCPCCKLEGQATIHMPGPGSPVWQRQFICVREPATLSRDTAAPSPLPADHQWQSGGTPQTVKDKMVTSSPSSLSGSESRASEWSTGESAAAASLPAPDNPSLAWGHLTPPLAVTRRLDVHLAQKALGSFILPPCVIHSQAAYANMAAERGRAAAREHRQEMNIRLQHKRGRKSQLRGPRQESLEEGVHPTGTEQLGFPSAGPSSKRLARESQILVIYCQCEMCRGLSTAEEERPGGPPHPAEETGMSSMQGVHRETSVCPKDTATSSDLSRGEQEASYQSLVLSHAAGGTLHESPTGPEDREDAEGLTWAHPPQPATREDTARGVSAGKFSPPPASGQWLARPSEECPQSAEELSQFSTEGEWEMVGDWDSEVVAALEAEGSSSLAWKERSKTQGRCGMEETGTRPRTGTRQAEMQEPTVALPHDQPPHEGKGPTLTGIMLGFLKRVTSRASEGQRGRDYGQVAMPQGALSPPQKLAPSPKGMTFSAEVHVQAEVKGCRMWVGGEQTEGAGRKELPAASQTRELPGNETPQGAGGAATDAARGDRPGGRVPREEPCSGGRGLSADRGGYQKRAAMRVTECREGKAHDPSGVPVAPTGPSTPWPPPPTCPTTSSSRTGAQEGERGEGVTTIKVADSQQLGTTGAQSCAARHVSMAGAFTSSQLEEKMVIIGLILEKKLGLRHGLYTWECSQERSKALWGAGGRREGAGTGQAGNLWDVAKESQRGDGSCKATAHIAAELIVEGAVRAPRINAPQGQGTDLPRPARAKKSGPVRHPSARSLQQQEGLARASQSGSATLRSSQTSPRESSRRRPRMQHDQGLSPSPHRARPRSRTEGPWYRGRARGEHSGGLRAWSRDRRSSSRGRPTGTRQQSRSREGESVAGEGVQDWQGACQRPPKRKGGSTTKDASRRVRASSLQPRGQRVVVETQLLPSGACPIKGANSVGWFHQHRAHAHGHYTHERVAARHADHLGTLRERMQARRRKLSTSLDSAASEEETRLWASNKT